MSARFEGTEVARSEPEWCATFDEVWNLFRTPRSKSRKLWKPFRNLTANPNPIHYFCRNEHAVRRGEIGPVRTGLEGPGLTPSQKVVYAAMLIGGRYAWLRINSTSALQRWGDRDRVKLCRLELKNWVTSKKISLSFLGIFH
jgi:hypothetical protein